MISFSEKSKYSQTSVNNEKQKLISGREVKRWHRRTIADNSGVYPIPRWKRTSWFHAPSYFFRFSAFHKSYSMEIISALVCDTLYRNVFWWFTAEETINQHIYRISNDSIFKVMNYSNKISTDSNSLTQRLFMWSLYRTNHK